VKERDPEGRGEGSLKTKAKKRVGRNCGAEHLDSGEKLAVTTKASKRAKHINTDVRKHKTRNQDIRHLITP